MKKISMIIVISFLLLSGCAPQFETSEKVSKKNSSNKSVVSPKYQLSDQYYPILRPFEPSKARGLVVSNLNTRYEVNEMEMGLMRMAQNHFDTKSFVFKEGAVLDSETLRLLLNRKFSKKQLKENKLKESENIGLNPLDSENGDITKRNEESPIYLSHILEHDYFKVNGDGKKLDGVVIGLALNSVHYYQKVEFGDTFNVKIPKEIIEKEGNRIAQEVLNRLRKNKKINDVPITIALYKQESSNSVVPGNYIAYTNVDEGETAIRNWETVDEEYVLFPSEEAKENHRDDVTYFLNFKQDVEKYFPSFNGMVGRGFYVEDQLQELNITIPMQFYGEPDTVGFTQYVTGLVMEHFPEYLSVEIYVNSVSGPESVIIRNQELTEPFVHIYR